ncbi:MULTISPECIES: L,D-transpeptidase family protein [unclassified Psychrobacter]|uniref:L,D-transpeptidase family protein n=1 Tax=unclassified Psychrobacter TaxID=196806 RepID=UPI0025B59CFC|nr:MULTISPECIES: L,D-transpeptidase family protein [unclassified Psychrobacter]MDN3454580.1 L,D-transpeptidase family protein [Psychrobacter sp. APC 3350]MDN3502095.1 L,D-transpeptidase family protein [Psychrobacter sp. 5A.1]
MAFLRNRSHRFLLILVGLGVVTVISSSVFNYMTRASASSSTFDNQNNQPIADVVIDKVFVDKSERRLQLLSGDDVIRTYRIALGDSPVGHKQQEGDERTPVGIYTLDYKNENSIAHRSIHISYPNAADKARAKQLGVSPGGDIMIHGQMNGFGHLAAINQKYDWTDGCIAVTDDEMDEIMAAVTLGIPIEIVE